MLYQKQVDSKVECQLVFAQDRHLSAIIRADLETYLKHKEEIRKVLAGIEQGI